MEKELKTKVYNIFKEIIGGLGIGILLISWLMLAMSAILYNIPEMYGSLSVPVLLIGSIHLTTFLAVPLIILYTVIDYIHFLRNK